MLKDPRVWRYCQYYSVVFGGYVALALWMTKYYVSEYGFDMKIAALLAACFSLPGGVLRALGGWISDKYGAYKVTWRVMWVCWVCFFLLSYPQTSMVIKTVKGDMIMNIGVTPLLFTVLLFIVGIATAIGKASVFKFISDDFTHNIGAVSGVVGLAGGLGGFILPIMFGALVDLTGVRSSAFMLLYGTVCVSLVWMHFSFKPERTLAADAASVAKAA
jgi:MFS transporter, NNP family, nitrate/nitrite transporter